MTQALQKLSIQISQNYLIQISSTIQALSHFYQQQQLQSLTPQYRNLLFSTFSTLNQSIQLYSNSPDPSSMISAAILKSKSQMEIYCLQKLGFLLRRQSEDLGKIVDFIIKGYKSNISNFQMILQSERRKRSQAMESEKDKIIEKLREQLLHRKEYISEIKQRLQEVQNENSKIYEKIIDNAKTSTERALSPSPKKNNSTILSPSLAKLKAQALSGTAHKTLSAKQVQQTIIDLMQTKQKQQTVKGKKVSLKNFLKTYFRYKFGMKQLADETQLNFRQAVQFFSQSQQRNIFILFMRMYNQVCEEQFFWELRLYYDRLIKIIKRYLNQKESISLDELQRIYDNKILDQRLDVRLAQRDVQNILINVYKTSQVGSLQMILNQILIPKIQKSSTNQFQYSEQILIPSKKFINQLLNYELSLHLQKIQDIVRMIKDVDNQRGYLNQQNLQTIIARLKIPQDKIQANLDLLSFYEGKFITYSEAIQVIDKIRKSKTKKASFDRNR